MHRELHSMSCHHVRWLINHGTIMMKIIKKGGED